MGVECWTIMLLVVVMAVLMLRRGESPVMGIATLPLAIVPFGYIISAPLARWTDRMFSSFSFVISAFSSLSFFSEASCFFARSVRVP